MADATVVINKIISGYGVSITINGETRIFGQKREELFGFAKSIKDEQFKKALNLIKTEINNIVISKEDKETFDEMVIRLTKELGSKEKAIAVATSMPTTSVFIPKETIEEIILKVEGKKYTV